MRKFEGEEGGGSRTRLEGDRRKEALNGTTGAWVPLLQPFGWEEEDLHLPKRQRWPFLKPKGEESQGAAWLAAAGSAAQKSNSSLVSCMVEAADARRWWNAGPGGEAEAGRLAEAVTGRAATRSPPSRSLPSES
eukprot:CAMPEP_0117648296 /NCGR_PEP_ID=MMETSP0804-20121206/319_1 /TAXON_ID=1074897 /ORGANISM="Tetraselmis astigmatica, Strain CCMP880" /LENGTH=133 /DNA_ID=CAMNT_0005453869 /DNA_START=102 /DNA_END=501 /DNA_ORIENTATION=+